MALAATTSRLRHPMNTRRAVLAMCPIEKSGVKTEKTKERAQQAGQADPAKRRVFDFRGSSASLIVCRSSRRLSGRLTLSVRQERPLLSLGDHSQRREMMIMSVANYQSCGFKTGSIGKGDSLFLSFSGDVEFWIDTPSTSAGTESNPLQLLINGNLFAAAHTLPSNEWIRVTGSVVLKNVSSAEPAIPVTWRTL